MGKTFSRVSEGMFLPPLPETEGNSTTAGVGIWAGQDSVSISATSGCVVLGK